MIIMEQYFQDVTGGYEIPDVKGTTTYYPNAVKEHWENMFYKSSATTNNDCSTQVGVLDSVKVPFGTIPVSFADGHTKAMAPGDFLGKTPTYQQYLGVPYSSYSCAATAAYYDTAVSSLPTQVHAWPLWGLQ